MPRKILLADDSVTAQNMGRKILADAGYEVVTVNNGSAALKRVNDLKPDLIVLDVYMPGYSGLEVCQRLKDATETEHIPVLLTVGKLEPFKPDEARRVRADAHIVKPFEASELLSALAKLEEQMAQAAPKPGNGAGKTAGGDPDTGWANRLRFPSKKKKGKETDASAEAEGSFHDFRRGKGKTAEAGPGGQEPEFVPNIPRDITPDELDALSALVAQMDAAKPADSDTTATDQREKATGAEQRETAGSASIESHPPEASEAETSRAGTLQASGSLTEAETSQSATQGKFGTVTVNAAFFAEEPAPVDPDDEPIFSTAPSVSAVSETKAKEPEEPAAAIASAPESEEHEVASETGDVEGPTPTEEELAAALKLLTPSTGQVEMAMPSGAILAAAGQMLAEEAARASGSLRWVAEAVALTPEEAAISLEAEMFQTFATKALGELDVIPGVEKVSKEPVAAESYVAETVGQVSESPADSVPMPAAEAVAEPAPETVAEAPTVEVASMEVAATETQAAATADEPPVSDVEAALPSAEALKAMAAAAAAKSASVSVTDPDAIASIVDSVLAGLRPKIVEEITKKLGGK